MKEILLPERAVGVAAGSEHTLVLAESGDVWALGRNHFGQLGIGQAAQLIQDIPHRISALAGQPSLHAPSSSLSHCQFLDV